MASLQDSDFHEINLMKTFEGSSENQLSNKSESDLASCSEMETDSIDVGNTYMYFQPVPTLEDMSTLLVSLETWNHYLTHCKNEHPAKNIRKVNEIVDNMKVPISIRVKIKTLCEKIKQNMNYDRYDDLEKMCNCNDDNYYDHNDGDERRHFFLYRAAWDTNGCVNEKKIAEKVLSCPRRLNDNDLMFKIITAFCLENYILEFPLNSLSKEFMKIVKKRGFREYQITYYWMKFKETQNSKIYDSYCHSALLSDLKRASYQGEWSVYEHFWDFFDEYDQVVMASNLIKSKVFKHLQLIIFCKLNRYQLIRLYSEQPVTIIVNFLLLEELELAKAAWHHVKWMITNDQFEFLIDAIWNKKENLTGDWNIQFLTHLWNSTPDYLIQYMICVKNYCEVITEFFKNERKIVSASCIDFFSAVLSQTTLEFRLKFFMVKGRYLILNYLHVFESLIQHCLNVTEQSEIKENLLLEAIESEPAGIMHRFRDLLYSNYEKFNEFLAFFTSKPELKIRFKKHLLQCDELVTSRGLWKAEIWAKLSQLIDETYLNPKEAQEQKKKGSIVIFELL